MKRALSSAGPKIKRLTSCSAVILLLSLVFTTQAQASVSPKSNPPDYPLTAKTFGVPDPTPVPAPAPCDPEVSGPLCDADSTAPYKPFANPESALETSGVQSYEAVPATGMWPYTPTLKILSHWPSGETSACSGMLVDAQTLITAASCVYTHQAERCLAGDAACWIEDLEAIPAYEDGLDPYGKSGYQTILTWTEWTDSQNKDYDLAAVQLRYPLGAYLGWLGIGFNNDNNFFLTDPFTSTSYPDSAPFSGERMAEWAGSFTDVNPETLYFSEPCDAGQVGASANSAAAIAYGVLSFEDSTLGTAVTRLTYEKFAAIRDFMDAGLPKGEVDLAVFDVQAAPKWNYPGQCLTDFSFYLSNHSDTDLVYGDYEFPIYLSTDNMIAADDAYLGSITFQGELPAGEGLRLSLPPGQCLALPEEVHGSEPIGGTFYLGVISTLPDAKSENNASNFFQPEAIWLNDSDNIYYLFPIWIN